jgi:hypothetical protein
MRALPHIRIQPQLTLHDTQHHSAGLKQGANLFPFLHNSRFLQYPMKTPLGSFAAAALFALLSTHASLAADPARDVTKGLMQEKLKDAQSVLGSVAIGDFAAIEKSAKHLVELSNVTNWYSRQSPEYDLFLNGFRRNAQALAKSAGDKNLEAASLAFVQLTLDCVSCHKYLRVPPTAGVQNLDLSRIAHTRLITK